MIKHYFIVFCFAIGLLGVGCLDLEFDEPSTTGEELTVSASTSIRALKTKLVGNNPLKLDPGITIRGIITADDRSGNFFRSIVVQDSTAAIEVNINQTSAYNVYAQNREVLIDCSGLYLFNDNGVIKLGGYTYTEGGATLVGDILNHRSVIKLGALKAPVAPVERTVNSLSDSDVSKLVILKDVQFNTADTAQFYADPVGRSSLNRELVSCSGQEIVVRSSGFATFAGIRTPSGKGTVTAIYSVFGRTKQLLIRDITDVVMTEPRCNAGTGGGGGGTTTVELLNISAVRALFTGTTTKAPSFKKIKGVVISDRANSNWDPRNLVVQDGAAGIVVRFAANHTFDLGDEIEVEIGALELSEFRKLLQVNNTPLDRAKKVGVGTLPTPRVATAKQVFDNQEAWESTLVSISSATISGGTGTYNGTLKVTDTSGSIDMFTRSQATFSGLAIATGAKTITAVVSQFDTPQIIIRSPIDIK